MVKNFGFAVAVAGSYITGHARVAELVDAHDSKSCSARSGGSIPSTGTTKLLHCCSLLHIAL
jgi:hypothetical protein